MVRAFPVGVGDASMKDRWVRARVQEDSFLLDDGFVNPGVAWKDFVNDGKFRWPVLGSFMNL